MSKTRALYIQSAAECPVLVGLNWHFMKGQLIWALLKNQPISAQYFQLIQGLAEIFAVLCKSHALE